LALHLELSKASLAPLFGGARSRQVFRDVLATALAKLLER